jgi:hypothetical protein
MSLPSVAQHGMLAILSSGQYSPGMCRAACLMVAQGKSYDLLG